MVLCRFPLLAAERFLIVDTNMFSVRPVGVGTGFRTKEPAAEAVDKWCRDFEKGSLLIMEWATGDPH